MLDNAIAKNRVMVWSTNVSTGRRSRHLVLCNDVNYETAYTVAKTLHRAIMMELFANSVTSYIALCTEQLLRYHTEEFGKPLPLFG